MRVIIDKEIYIGCDLCPQISLSVFEMKDEKATVMQDPVAAEEFDNTKEAAETCPGDAIIIIEE